MSDSTPYGFRIVGPCHGDRKLIDWHRAFKAYCYADPAARVDSEGYLSAFTFGQGFADHLRTEGTTKGYTGDCGADWLWFDLDRDETQGGIEAALADARNLAVRLCEDFSLDESGILAFFSGSKGFHVGLPLAGFAPTPGPLFHKVARRCAEQIAQRVGVAIDTAVYDRVRAFRAPNSRHAKTGCHKRRFEVDELLHLSADRIIELSAEPQAFDPPGPGATRCDWEPAAMWHESAEAVRAESEAAAERRAAIASGDAPGRLNRSTLDFIREGAQTGERHRRLFSAAADLAENGAPIALCEALLSEAALDTGLPPSEVKRQIQCGFDHAMKGAN